MPRYVDGGEKTRRLRALYELLTLIEHHVYIVLAELKKFLAIETAHS